MGVRFTQSAIESLMQHEWSGNVRELSNLVERMIIIHPNEIVDAQDLPKKYQYNVTEDDISEKDALLNMFSDDDSSYDTSTLDDDDSEDKPKENNDANNDANNPLAMPFNSVLPANGVNLKEMVVQIEIDMIKQALAASDGVVARAAEILQMRRTTLVEKIKKYGI